MTRNYDMQGEHIVESVNRKNINLYELISCLTDAVDLISPELADHHQQVAYLSYEIAKELKLPKKQQNDLLLAGMLHDVGAFSLEERLALIEEESLTASHHAFKGAHMLENFHPLTDVANIIRYHHIPWNSGEGRYYNEKKVSFLSHIVHLSDRIAVLINKNYEIIGQIKGIRDAILLQKGTIFVPELVDAFIDLSHKEYVWLDTAYKPLLDIIPKVKGFVNLDLNIEDVVDLTKIFACIIDFRSPFTANHSAGVAKTAEKLAELAGFSPYECKMMLVSGYLHDLGKLAVKNDVLEKPGKLNVDEFNLIKSHTFYTYRLLQTIQGFETINKWASFHHEKLNGQGYPFHLSDSDIPLGSRIIAVADVFTAITEERPYRKGMRNEQVIRVLDSMVLNKSICSHVVSILLDNYDLVNQIRQQAQDNAANEYSYFNETSPNPKALYTAE